MARSTSSPWPPTEGVTTPIIARNDAVLSTTASTHINAPAALVFEAIRDVANFGAWNQFCPRVTIESQPEGASDSLRLNIGTTFTFHVIMNDSKPNKQFATYLRVTDISTPEQPSSYIPASVLADDATYTADLNTVYRISWAVTGVMARGLPTERFHEVIALGENECEVRTWENHGGMMAHTVKWMYKQTLVDKFQLWCADLKRYCEEKTKHETTPSD